jgi:apolipoprotein N-acyltransferase
MKYFLLGVKQPTINQSIKLTAREINNSIKISVFEEKKNNNKQKQRGTTYKNTFL